MGVLRLGYLHVRVTDLAEAAGHYSNTLGMDQVADTDGRALPQVLGRIRPPLGRPRRLASATGQPAQPTGRSVWARGPDR